MKWWTPLKSQRQVTHFCQRFWCMFAKRYIWKMCKWLGKKSPCTDSWYENWELGECASWTFCELLGERTKHNNLNNRFWLLTGVIFQKHGYSGMVLWEPFSIAGQNKDEFHLIHSLKQTVIRPSWSTMPLGTLSLSASNFPVSVLLTEKTVQKWHGPLGLVSLIRPSPEGLSLVLLPWALPISAWFSLLE